MGITLGSLLTCCINFGNLAGVRRSITKSRSGVIINFRTGQRRSERLTTWSRNRGLLVLIRCGLSRFIFLVLTVKYTWFLYFRRYKYAEVAVVVFLWLLRNWFMFIKLIDVCCKFSYSIWYVVSDFKRIKL